MIESWRLAAHGSRRPPSLREDGLLTMETFARVKDHDSLHRLSRGGRQWDSGGLGNSALWMRR